MTEPGAAVAMIFAVCCSALALIVSVVVGVLNYRTAIRAERLFIAHLRAWHRGTNQ